MDKFDFSVPVSVTIIFDDNDNETLEMKSSVKELESEKEEATNVFSKFEQAHEVVEKQSKKCISTLNGNNDNKLTTEICASVKHEIESITNAFANNTECNKEKNHVLPQKVLDMLLEKENNYTDNCDSSVKNYKENEDTGKKNITYTEGQNAKQTLTENVKVSKRRHTEKLNSSDKSWDAIHLAATDKKMCKTRITTDVNLCNKNNATESHQKVVNELNLACDNNGVQQQDSNSVAVISKYFYSIDQSVSNLEKKCNMINAKSDPTSQTIDQERSNRNESFQSLNDTTKTVTGYLEGLLDTVSEHMLFILNFYQSYVKLYRANADPKVIDDAKNKYLASRKHFFDLSYSSVVNVILPRHNDPIFVEKFLADTIQLSHLKSCYYSYEQIKPLYFEMVTWVQKRQIQIQKLNICEITNPILVQELQKPPKKPVLPRNSTEIRLPWRDINKSQDSHESSQYRQLYPTVQHLQNPIPQKKPPPPYQNQNQQYLERGPALNKSCSKLSKCPEHSNIGQTYSQQQYTHRLHNDILMPSNVYEQNTLHKSHTHQQQKEITETLSYTNYNNEVQKITQHQNRGAPSLSSVTTTGQNQAPHAWQNDVSPSYAQNFQYYQETISSQNNNQPETTMLLEPNRSSISRDSGFMSPLNFNTNNEISLQEEQTPEQSQIPLITHVTSLNPSVSLIKDGNCAVCGKVTKQMCLGCFNYYYCGHACQFLDWKRHQLVCK